MRNPILFIIAVFTALSLLPQPAQAQSKYHESKKYTGAQFATTATQKVAFHGATPVVQRSGSAQAAVTATAATVATADGSDAATTQALANALKVELNKVIADNVAQRALLNELRAALVQKGLIKGGP